MGEGACRAPLAWAAARGRCLACPGTPGVPTWCAHTRRARTCDIYWAMRCWPARSARSLLFPGGRRTEMRFLNKIWAAKWTAMMWTCWTGAWHGGAYCISSIIFHDESDFGHFCIVERKEDLSKSQSLWLYLLDTIWPVLHLNTAAVDQATSKLNVNPANYLLHTRADKVIVDTD